uniref:BLOC-1-related complex subunit 5 n=1 Tax=Parastrongyloides trichosuri TaxID=131310 RepID=A0A0N4ZSB5_PARTI
MNDKATRKLNQKMNEERSIDGRIIKVANKFTELTKKVMQSFSSPTNMEFLSALSERSRYNSCNLPITQMENHQANSVVSSHDDNDSNSICNDNHLQYISVFDKVMDYLSRIPDDIKDAVVEDMEVYDDENDNVYNNFDNDGGEENCEPTTIRRTQPIDIPIQPIEKNPFVGSPHIEYKVNAITGQKYISNIFVNKPKLF